MNGYMSLTTVFTSIGSIGAMPGDKTFAHICSKLVFVGFEPLTFLLFGRFFTSRQNKPSFGLLSLQSTSTCFTLISFYVQYVLLLGMAINVFMLIVGLATSSLLRCSSGIKSTCIQ